MLALVHPLPSPADHRTVDRSLDIPVVASIALPSQSSSSSARSSKPSSHRKPPIQHLHQQESSSVSRTPSGASTVAFNPHPARPNAAHPQHPANQQPTYPSAKKTPLPSDRPSARAPPQQAPPPPPPVPQTLDIHSYAQTDLLRLLASLLTQIASTNDALASTDPAHSLSSLSHPVPPDDPARTPIWRSLTSASRASLSNPASALTFHARNIPTIALEAYLLRILRYCPTTNEVFLALLVYFDRMSRLANEATGRTFVIDSYNVHRLVIAGVTVASKFFSDVFYTNSRYAKVELNQLELQFLLLNDFRLVISPDEMQKYAEQLVVFSQTHQPLSPSSSHPSLSPSGPPSSSLSTPPLRSPPKPHSATYPHSGPARAMGAIDAYGGTVAPDRTPNMRAIRTPSSSSHSAPSTAYAAQHPHPNHHSHPHHHLNTRDDDASSILSTDTEATETDGGDTTDDEPTIRPPNSGSSCCGDALEDTGGQGEGVFQADGIREDGERDDRQDRSVESIGEKRVNGHTDVEGDGDRGDATPELRAQRRVPEVSEDIGMASP
ncbi:hypothetical protein ID866_5573 [Astraeus odoratus]|nr:hypothetical protein ID866_5573 [Astraeus odoratus]